MYTFHKSVWPVVRLSAIAEAIAAAHPRVVADGLQ